VKKRKWLVPGIVALVVAVIAFAVFKKPRYTVLGKVEKGTLIEAVYGIATVTADKSYTLKVAQSNVVSRVFVKEGQRVKKGDALVEIEGAALRTPIEGTVSLVAYKDGETVPAQGQIVSIFDLAGLYYVVTLEQQGALKVRPGQMAKISFDSIRDQVFEGQVSSIYAQGSSFNVSISAKTLPDGVLPGMTADVAIEIARHDNRTIVPVAGIRAGELSILSGRHLVSVPVKVGLVDAAKAEIIEGDVAEGATVAVPKAKAQ
jgi:macrolide-specific efflux system membrane fusion protein